MRKKCVQETRLDYDILYLVHSWFTSLSVRLRSKTWWSCGFTTPGRSGWRATRTETSCGSRPGSPTAARPRFATTSPTTSTASNIPADQTPRPALGSTSGTWRGSTTSSRRTTPPSTRGTSRFELNCYWISTGEQVGLIHHAGDLEKSLKSKYLTRTCKKTSHTWTLKLLNKL